MATLAPAVVDSSINPLVRRPLEGASCPLCHTAASSASAAFAWQCRTCGQHWTALRLETVAAYDAWSARQLSAITRGASDLSERRSTK